MKCRQTILELFTQFLADEYADNPFMMNVLKQFIRNFRTAIGFGRDHLACIRSAASLLACAKKWGFAWSTMREATCKLFEGMLHTAQKGGYAYPAINCSSIHTINVALSRFAAQQSIKIIQSSTGIGQFACGLKRETLAFLDKASMALVIVSLSNMTCSSRRIRTTAALVESQIFHLPSLGDYQKQKNGTSKTLTRKSECLGDAAQLQHENHKANQ